MADNERLIEDLDLKLELDAKELVLMSNLYLNKDFPHNYMTLEEVADLLQISKATAITLTKELEKKGCITKVKSFISFYYPIRDAAIRRKVLEKLGFFSQRSA